MCGIAGIVGDASPEAIDSMIGVMRHRGPDAFGTYVAPAERCLLGHARLAIIDTSSAGRQPMKYAARYWITFNGEIYNYRELRSELQSLGHRFATDTDTEVLLAAYASWGPSCLSRLSGMFAFGIWDTQSRELFLARDRIGIKPLYFANTLRGFVFASELRGLLASGLVERVADPQAIADFLSLGAVPQPRTILAGVEMLLPGHYAVLRDGIFTRTQYWSITQAPKPSVPPPPRFEAQASRLRHLLEAATARHLVADVPVGAFLSGGVDSRIVVGLMSGVARDRIRTFTIGFEGARSFYDEREAARDAAASFDCIHTETVLTAFEVERAADQVLADVDQPSVDGFNTWFVSRAARATVTVALSGLGGDELFAGYRHFATLARASRALPAGLSWLMPVARMLAEVPPRRLGRAIEQLSSDAPGRIATLRRILRDDEKQAILQGSAMRSRTYKPITDYCRTLVTDTSDVINDLCVAEVTGYLRSTLLRDADAMSMAHSLEVRPVLLDHEVVEFAAALPGQSKAGGALGKRVLLAACRDLLPSDIGRRAKRGFEIPVVDWLGSQKGGMVYDTLSGSTARTVFADAFLTRAKRSLADPARQARSWWPAFLLLDYLDRHSLQVGF